MIRFCTGSGFESPPREKMVKRLPCLGLLCLTIEAFQVAPRLVTPARARLPTLARHPEVENIAKAATVPFLLFGKTSSQLFPVQNLALLSWLLYLLLPRWKLTPVLALIAPTVHSLLYGNVMLHMIQNPVPGTSVSFSSLEGIMKMQMLPDGAFAGWLHYCTFDPLVGLAIVLDAKRVRVPHAFCVPCIVATAFMGPVGFLSYLLLRTLVMQKRRFFPPKMVPPKGFRWSTQAGFN
jgi:hypothetical protein